MTEETQEHTTNKGNKLLVYLIVEFNWPEKITPDMASASANLHKKVIEASWIDEVMTGYGGVGGDHQCTWIFSFDTYSALEQLLHPNLHTKADEISEGYYKFFNQMRNVVTKIRHQVLFQ